MIKYLYRVKRISKRLFFYLAKFLVSKLVFIHPRLYQYWYNKLLFSTKMKIKGTPRFIATSASFDDFDKISLGDRIIVSSKVYFLTHDYSITIPIHAKEEVKNDISVSKSITIGDNVFIGMNSLILPGSNVGNNVIIGAGSIVRGNVPSNSVYIGNPGKVVMTIEEYYDRQVNKGINLVKDYM
jgi:acetyltransferase-like isoleucine patch superfamily enzyme